MISLQKSMKKIVITMVLFAVLTSTAFAKAGEVAVWVPWFADEGGAESALKNIDSIDVLYPFVYEVNPNGTLRNRVDFGDTHWEDLLEVAEEKDVPVIPTIAWFDGEQIHQTLSNSRSRKAHIKEIEKMVKDGGFDGVGIDYEQKKSKTINDFSTFLKDLKKALGRKLTLTCTLEARTPPDSLYKDVPKVIDYSNDYKQINRHCDVIEIMAYDQQRADIKLNNEKRGVPYNPVADKDWVEKVVKLAIKDLDKDKVMLGVATYGRAWDVTVAPEWYRDYTRVASLNQPRILELSKIYNSPIGRTAGGEAVISYFPENSPYKIFNQLPTPAGTPKGFEAAAKALMVANITKMEIPVRVVIWSDAEAIDDKLNLVEKYGLRGTAVFKVDGEEDPKLWKLL
jgi:spore germination protein YaaH